MGAAFRSYDLCNLTIDKSYDLWYNIIRKGKGKSQTPERNYRYEQKAV